MRQALSCSLEKPKTLSWHHSSLRRYLQLWHQLSNVDGVVCRTYQPGPTSDVVKVPLMPTRLQQDALHQSHDLPGAGHQGTAKTLARLQQEAYWVGMAKDVQLYCQQYTTCQHDQTAASITKVITKICSTFGIPSILHSDQGRNFESHMLCQMLQAFGIKKSRTTAYHPQCDGMVEWFNHSLLQLLRCYVSTEEDWENYLPLVLYMHIVLLLILRQVYLPSS